MMQLAQLYRTRHDRSVLVSVAANRRHWRQRKSGQLPNGKSLHRSQDFFVLFLRSSLPPLRPSSVTPNHA